MRRQTAIVVGGAIAVAVLVGVAGFLINRPATVRGADPNDLDQVALGQVVYRENCASCHGVALEGEDNWRTPRADGSLPAPPHDATGHTWHHPDQLLFEITKRGGRPFSPKSNMPGFGGSLSDQEIWAVLAYIKSTWPPQVLARQAQINEANRTR